MAVNANMPILIVDDNRTMVRITSQLLRQAGFVDVDGASDGAEALAMVQAKPYRLVISDWNMAEVSGLDLLRKLRTGAGTSGPRFIMATAEGSSDRIVQA